MTNCSSRPPQRSAPSWKNWLRKKWKAYTNWRYRSSWKSALGPTGATWNSPFLRITRPDSFFNSFHPHYQGVESGPNSAELAASAGHPVGGKYAQDSSGPECDSARSFWDFI